MSAFEFATATQIIFGAGALKQIGTLAASFGNRALIMTGHTPGRAAVLLKMLDAAHVAYRVATISEEPTVETVQRGLETARNSQCDFVIGFGGGSAIDAGKAIAALLTNGGDPLDYLEVIGKGRTISKPSAPYLAIPTTAGPGTEVTRNAVLKSVEHKVKVSMRSPLMLPRLALIDPELTYTLPPSVTASTGLDALTQVIEPFVSNAPNPLTDALCREGMTRAARSLLQAYRRGDDSQAREDMAIASLCGGLALANARLGAVHGFAGPAGGMFPAPHGAVCARLLPVVMAVNVQALQERAPENPALRRYDDVARMLTGKSSATSRDGVAWIQELCQALAVPALSAHGMTVADIPTVAEKAAQASSMKGNPIPLTMAEMQEILRQAL